MFWTIMHLFGVVIGAGGAFASDIMFLSSVRDRNVSHVEMRFLKIGSGMVWLGLLILLISGIGIFLSDPTKYLASDKFLSKMTIFVIIIINGLFFYFLHIPRLAQSAGKKTTTTKELHKHGAHLLISGVVSVVSWAVAIIIGAFRGLPLSYLSIISIYISALALGFILVILFHRKIYKASGLTIFKK